MTIHIRTIQHQPFAINSYVVWHTEDKQAVLVDVGRNVDEIRQVLEDEQLTCEDVLHTHAFLECLEGQPDLRETHDIICHMSPMDEFWLAHLDTQATVLNVDTVPMAFVDQQVLAGDTIDVGQLSFQVLSTPGNTPGSTSFYLPEAHDGQGAIFVGDVLFKGQVGPVDVPHGCINKLKTTIEDHLFTLPDTTVVYPSRGPITTIGTEKASNQFQPVRYGKVAVF